MQTPALISFFRTTVLAGVTALLITSAGVPLFGQNTVPPTAVQAAKMPQYASRLARATGPPSRSTPASHSPGRGNFVYENGPIDGTTDAWTINFGFVVSNTFTLTSVDTPVGMSFGVWLFPGDVLESAELSVTSEANGGTSYFDQTVNFYLTGCLSNQFGYDVCTATAEFHGLNLNAGTYWMNLQNAAVNTGDPAYWDENSGAGCDSRGCPSQAVNEVGTIPSESFSLLADCKEIDEKPEIQAKVVTVPRSPTQTYRVIYNFTGTGDGGFPFNSLTIDATGNLYGTTGSGGPSGFGTAFKLSPSASGWRFNRLYPFSGADTGSPSSPLVIGANGALFGTGAGYLTYGALFELAPGGHISPSVFSSWMETLLYGFTDGNSGGVPSGSIVLDGSDNVYGTTAMGGTGSGGTLYEYTDGGIQVLHAFPAFRGDGYRPLGVVSSRNGLYGITRNGGSNGSGAFYTTAGGYQVLYNFEATPNSLAADPFGNLFGTWSYSSSCGPGNTTVFKLSPPNWTPFTLTNFDRQLSSWVSTDALGNVYGTTDNGGQNSQGNVFKLACCWNYTDLHDFSASPNDGANPSSGPVVDAHGNIYGTTPYGGTYGHGVVWEISP